MPINAPTRISATSSTYNDGAGTKTVSISFNAGDLIAVMSVSEGGVSTDDPATPTATGLTFTSIRHVGPLSTGAQAAGRYSNATAGAGGSGVTVSVTNADTSDHWGFTVWVYRNSGGFGNSAITGTPSTTKVVSLTSAQTNSAIIWSMADWSSETLGTLTPTPTDTIQRANDGSYCYYAADLSPQASTSATNYGITGGGSAGPFTIMAAEITGLTSTVYTIPLLGAGPA